MMRSAQLAASCACVAIALFGLKPSAHAETKLNQGLHDPSSGGTAEAPLELRGQSSFHVSVFHIYDAELWTPRAGFSWDNPFRLRLTYARKITANQLVNASIKEMARVFGGEARDFEDMRMPLAACFRDVKKGDVLEGVSQSRDRVRFYFNGKQTCNLAAPQASYKFFSIWLSERSRSPKQARHLLGE